MNEHEHLSRGQADHTPEPQVGDLERADQKPKRQPLFDVQADGKNSIELSLKLLRAGEAAFELSVDLTLPSSGTTVIFGPSGGGKTTILRAIAGLEPDVTGHIRINQKTWQAPGVFVPAHQRRVGFVFQHSALLPHLSVEQNLRYGWQRVGGTLAEYAHCVEQLDLAPLLQRAIGQLSGGERQRVALGRALLTRPDILLLDEPLAALDAARRSEILGYLERLKHTTTIPMLYVTHAVDEMSRLADYLVLMKGGRVRQVGPALEVMNHPDAPLALRDDAGVVVQASVQQRDAHGLLTLQSPTGTLYAHGPAHEPGDRLRVRIHARDVSLALSHHTDSSMLNILPVTVLALRDGAGGQALIELSTDNQPEQRLLAKISHASVARLNIVPGLALWAQIKAVALLV
jgi:molybdate transport system ATP-binding protein